MTDEVYNRILAAGVEFYSGLKQLLEKHGLDEQHVPSIVMVALGAVISATEMTPEEMAGGGHITKRFWSLDQESELPLKARFSSSPQGN